MNFAISVLGGPQSSSAPLSALLFARAVLEAGHQISRVFFYQDAVLTANANNCPPQDEPNLTAEWSEFAAQHELELIVCIASALRRGVVDEAEARRHDKPAANLAPGFTISGLGQLIDSALNAERLVTFK